MPFQRKQPTILFIPLLLVFFPFYVNSQVYINEDFSSGLMPPTGWTLENNASQWTINVSGFAGGSSPEARFQWVQQVDTTRLISPLIDLSGISSVNFQFRHMYDDYTGEGPAVGVATRSGSGSWNIVWDTLPEGNVASEKIELVINNENVGQPDFQLCCFIAGDLFNLDYWYVDDIQLYRPIQLDIKLFLEGPFQKDEMTTILNMEGYLPLSQPFNVAPWNYNVDQSVNYIPGPDVVDWVLVTLMQYNQYAVPAYSTVERKAAFLLKNGHIVDTDGISPVTFDLPLTGNQYLWIHHRNHLAVMSSTPLGQGGESKTIDFTTSTGMAKFGKYSLSKVEIYKFALASGDGNADGQINTGDKSEVWMTQVGNTGYYSGDFNLDGTVDMLDLEACWEPNSGRAHWIPDTTQTPFLCGDTLVDSRDGQSYLTIEIGNQCWMEENLNYNTGTNWCYYNSDYYCDTYGRLYNWSSIMNGASASSSVPSGVQGICPGGWHLPSDGEWCQLTHYIDSTVVCETTGYNGTDAGIKMKSTSGWSSGGNGTNASGFNALPGGCMGIYHFDDLYLFAYFWTTSDYYPGYAYIYKFNYGLPTVGRYFSQKNRGYSVRCVKD